MDWLATFVINASTAARKNGDDVLISAAKPRDFTGLARQGRTLGTQRDRFGEWL
jgi:hypothetical protein